ncbi:MAG: transposase, partial [Chloroflexota bacterium]
FFRESPWKAEDISGPRKRFMVKKFLELARQMGIELVILIGVDDSLGKKGKATRHLQAVDFHHNHTESTGKKQVYTNGYVYVEVHVQIGPIGFLFDTRLYQREKKVRLLNRERESGHRLHYRSKYHLARNMLEELAQLLPQGHRVYVLFDSWYASAKLIKFCRRQRWHVICAIKSNRRIDKKRIDQHNQALKHQSYQRVTLEALDPRRKTPTYVVRTIHGHLQEMVEPVQAFISKKRSGDKHPKYFACTDMTLSAQQALRYYQKRWPVEVDNLYLKDVLGLGDFRLQSFEAAEKWFAVVVLAINYLQFQAAQAYLRSHARLPLADFIRQHRLEHLRILLRTVIEEARLSKEADVILAKYLPAASSLMT